MNSLKSRHNTFRVLLITGLMLSFFSEFIAQTPPYSITSYTDGVMPGLILASPVKSANQIYICAFDEVADPALSVHTPLRGFLFEPWGNDEFIFYNYDIRRWVIIDSDLTPTDTLASSFIDETDYHDVHRFDDGSYLLVNNHLLTMDLSQLGGLPDATVIEPILLHLAPDETIIREWRGMDYIPLSSNLNLTFSIVDYLHWNSFDIDSLGGILMNFRTISQIVRLEPIDWNIDWKMGGVGNEFLFDDVGWDGFLNQHDVNDIGNGHFLIFDNNEFSGSAPSYSRVVEYNVDTVAMTVTRVWSYSHPNELFAPAQGSVERLENGNTLITWGLANAVEGNGTIITEIDSLDNIVWEIMLGPYFSVYRARKFPTSEIVGCRNVSALNYDPGAIVNDLSCVFGVDNDGDGMLDSEGDCNDGVATIYLGAPEIPNDGIDQDCDGEDLIFILGCTNVLANNFDPTATDENGSCVFELILRVDMFLHGGSAELFTDLGTITGEHVNFSVWRFTLLVAEGNLNYKFVDDSGIQELDYHSINVTGPTSLSPVCFDSTFPCPGCLNAEYADFNPFADSTLINSSCLNPATWGCTYMDAINFNPLANLDDGFCVCNNSFNSNCLGDLNLDNTVSIEDLLILMTEFGSLCN